MNYPKGLQFRTRYIHLYLILILFGCLGCSHKGLISDRYPEDFYRVPKLLQDGPLEKDPTFIVYSDNQAGWRGREKFLERENWATWKMLIFPFYELYWLGNGVAGGVNWIRQEPDYSAKEQAMVRDAIYAAAKKRKVDFILNTGDISAYDGRRPDHWASFLKMNKVEHPLLNEIPYLPVAGNHDQVNDTTYGFKNYRSIFQYPRFYVQDFPNGALFVLDSNYILDQNDYIDNEMQDLLFRKWFVSEPGDDPSWLEIELSSREVPFKIVAMHHPLISFGGHNGDWYIEAFGNDLLAKRQKLIDLFVEHGVTLVFSGHDHFYQHNIYYYGDRGEGNEKEIHFIVGGGGGTPLKTPADTETILRLIDRFGKQGMKVGTIKQAQKYHYSVVTVSDTVISGEVFEAGADSTMPATLIDHYILPGN